MGVRGNALILGMISASLALAQPVTAATPQWVTESNAFTQKLLDVQFKHGPEGGSRQGLAKYDALISTPTLADDLAARKEYEAVLAQLKTAQKKVTDKNVQEDLQILFKTFDLNFRREDYDRAHEVPFINASKIVFGGLHGLLDEQVAAERRPAALERLRKYAGAAKGFKPFTEILKQRVLEQLAKPDVFYPSKGEIESELGRNASYLEAIPSLFQKYKIAGWEKPFAQLKDELTAYDDWVRSTILPKARTDFRLPPEQYALAFEGYGIDIPPAEIARMAHEAFTQYQAEMKPLAAAIAKARGFPSADYRNVIAELKKQQITGDAILPFFETRLHEIERIITVEKLVTLPDRPAIIRLASAAETAQQPAPHMQPPALLHNTGQRGEFVLPLVIPSATGGSGDQYDDFTFDAVTWTLIAHEARPGHELQFDSMVEHGVSLARALYAFNSTNAEGWGLYSEYIMQPFEPPEGQLMTLQLRLLRAARAILDPELQSGKVTPDQAYYVLEYDVALSHAFAKEEVERFTYRSPGQANSYFYGYTKLLALRKEVETALGPKFDQKKFHDFILSQGLLPPDLMRKAVIEDFVTAQH
jgi:uncharacterized protein (DUF885 family)